MHCLRLVEAGLSTLAQDYVRVLADYVVASVAGGHVVEQETVPGWVGYTAYLAEKLKYLVSYLVLQCGGKMPQVNPFCCNYTYITCLQDPVYTTSVGEISEIADPDWLVSFREAVTTLQYGAHQWDSQAEYSQYGEGGEQVDSQAEDLQR
jgi:hypothetical protein